MLEVRNLCKAFGGIEVTKNVSFSLKKGERRVILGPNGAGKTTLFNLIVGELLPSSGDIFLDGVSLSRLSIPQRARAGLSRSYQKNNLFESLTMKENLALAATAGMQKAHGLTFDSLRDKDVLATVEKIAAQVQLCDALDWQVQHAPYGFRRQLEVGLALATRPRVLLMDEPTSGVGPDMIERFHNLLASLPQELTVVIIEHDLDLAFDIADYITVLNYGEIVFEGTPEETRGNKTVRDIYLGDWQANG